MLKKMKIGKRLNAGFVLVAVLASLSGLLSIFIINDLTGRYGDALENYGFTQGDIGKAMAAFCRVDGNVHDTIGYLNAEDRAQAFSDFQEQADQMDDYFDAVKKTSVTEEEDALADKVIDAWSKYRPLAEEIMKLAEQPGQVQKAQERLVSDLDPHWSDIYYSLADLMDTNVTIGNDLDARLQKRGDVVNIIMIVIMVVAFVLACVLAWVVSAGITKPLQEVESAAEKMEGGSLAISIDYQGTDEIGALADSIRRLSRQMTRLFKIFSTCSANWEKEITV